MPDGQNLRILVVEDEPAIRRFLKASLALGGYHIFESATGRDALRKSVSAHPDIIILDLGLPDMEGIAVIRAIRKRSNIPIVILSIKEDVSDKTAALDAGADDYLTKPFSTEELSARLRAVARRLLTPGKNDTFRVDKLAVDFTKRRVTMADNEINLTPTEYDILKLLILNAGGVLTHRQILRQIWDKNADLEGILHLLRVTISNLRNKIEPSPERPVYIITEPGIGYRLRNND